MMRLLSKLVSFGMLSVSSCMLCFKGFWQKIMFGETLFLELVVCLSSKVLTIEANFEDNN